MSGMKFIRKAAATSLAIRDATIVELSSMSMPPLPAFVFRQRVALLPLEKDDLLRKLRRGLETVAINALRVAVEPTQWEQRPDGMISNFRKAISGMLRSARNEGGYKTDHGRILISKERGQEYEDYLQTRCTCCGDGTPRSKNDPLMLYGAVLVPVDDLPDDTIVLYPKGEPTIPVLTALSNDVLSIAICPGTQVASTAAVRVVENLSWLMNQE